MNGASSLFATLADCGVTACFANPGTTELQLVAAMADEPITPILTLHENVATGAADGYGRVARAPACTLLHLGPGLANGIANLHNARRARTPLINLVGDHPTWHTPSDPPLNMPIQKLAACASDWVRSSEESSALGRTAAAAWQAATARDGQVATLIVPADHQEGIGITQSKPDRIPHELIDQAVVDDVRAASCRTRTAWLLGGQALTSRGLALALRASAKLGATLLSELFPAVLERGGSLPNVQPVPYWPDKAIELLGQFETVVLVGTSEPVSMFGHDFQQSRLIPSTARVISLASPQQNALEALQALTDETSKMPSLPTGSRSRAGGPVTAETLALAVGLALPENAIVVLEAVSGSAAFRNLAVSLPQFTQLGLTGGAIGQGLPNALGAAIAAPDRPVICLQADGAGLYSVQALWSMARHGCNVTVVVYSNRSYNILRIEGDKNRIPKSDAFSALTSLDHPPIDWALLAKGLGVPSWTVDRAEDLSKLLSEVVSEPGPKLIEAKMSVAT